jgi:quinol monooxygenase YgiN
LTDTRHEGFENRSLTCRNPFDRGGGPLMFVAIAIHHARPAHAEDFVAYMLRVRAAVGDPPGLIDFHGYRDTQTARLVGLSRWESEAAFQAALPRIGSLRAERREEWSERPDDVLMLSRI